MKNLLLSSALLITCVSGFAQLTVKPAGTNASTDRFMYVKNTVVYVEGTINLEKNNAGPGTTEASIYLREDGQLIQGGDNSTNTGDGFLSVQQTSPINNAWAYNYWCSPVGNPTLAPSDNTNFGVNSIYEDINPVKGIGTAARQSANVTTKFGYLDPKLTISSYWLYQLRTAGTEALANYTPIHAANDAWPGFGFTMKGVNTTGAPGNTNTGSHVQLYEFRGRPNSGDFPIPVAGPAPGPGTEVETAKMTLTGNPYPSALDLNKVFHDTSNNELDCIYFYDEDRSVMSHSYSRKPFGYGVWVPGDQDPYTDGVPNTNYGSYVSASFFIWNPDGTTSHGEGTGANQDNDKRFAPIGQGFMFVGNGTGIVTIKNSHRIFRKQGAAYESVFQRTAGEDGNMEISEDGNTANRGPAFDTAEGSNQIPQLRLYVTFDNTFTRDLLLLFHPQTSDGYDRGFDGLSPMGMQTEAYFPIGPDSDRRAYAIQGTNYEPRKMIPLTFKLHQASQVEVRAVEEIRKPYEKVYLFDRQENTYRPLSALHSAAGTFSLPAGVYEDRFFLVFRTSSINPYVDGDLLDLQDKAMAEVNMFQNNPARQFEIKNPDGYKLKAAYMYDMNGKLVITETNLGDANSYSFYTGNLSDGVYLVKLVTSEDIVINHKALVTNK